MGIIHRLLMWKLHLDGPEDAMQFILGNYFVWFSKVEFCLITGLKFIMIPDIMRYEMVENRIHHRYFTGRYEVEYEQLRVVLWLSRFEQQYDVVKLCLLYILNWILLGLDEREKIPV
ncbi:hypothetical protein Ddye_001044 [Dipteronia dyeriana]|uniref:DUF1985 domain-containing protein n=1 Tax=Dipteronia dyeriana TaxID=168575 RepID=A0AAE0CSY0_9ROSI|nr:hypothetical protein Ddye_001044 [Dipteronia dyeriana]